MMMTKLGIPEKVLFIVQQVGIRASVLLDCVQGNVTGNRGVAVNEKPPSQTGTYKRIKRKRPGLSCQFIA
jgi:hypothetical protein